ncbi:MAG: hypothetical protein IIB25_12985 [Chloroflexi bacterium]|nr:hypothetical protein [Chloroflexota bacterium]
MPTDGTAGFRENGLITWNINDLVSPTWAVATVNGQSAFYIQITRTQASLSTDAIEDLFEISTPTNYHWDKDGVLFVESLTTGVNSRTVTSEGISETVEIISHINDAFTESVEFTAMRHSDTTENGATFYAIRSRGTHISQAVVQENDIIFWLRGEGHDGTDFNDAASIIFKVDGTPGANDMRGIIIFSTTPDGAATVTEALRIDSSQNTILPATKKLYLDGGGNTYISEAAADQLELWVGGGRQFLMKTTEMVVNEDQADVDFRVESNDRDKAIYLDAGANVVQFKGVRTRISSYVGLQHFDTLVSAKTNITDNVATDVLRITIPNNEVSGQLHVRYVGGSEAGKDWNSGAIVVDFNRTTTVPAEAQLTQIEANRYNVTGGGTTSSIAWSLQLNGEGSGVTETIDLQVTIDTSDGSQGTVFYVAQFMTNPDSNGLGGTPPSLTEL